MASCDLVVFGLGSPTKFSPSILGSGVGGHAVRVASEKGLTVKAVARNPAKYEALFSNLPGVQVVQGDVTDRASVASLLAGAKAAIFAAQAADGVAVEVVDRDALGMLAEECAKVDCKLVVISSAFVSPKHRFNPLRAYLNTVVKWNMMDGKFAGEELVRGTKALRYVIIRPCALMDKPTPLGNDGCKIGQGDSFLFSLSSIPKLDVGRIAVEAALDDEHCVNVTFEIAGGKQQRTSGIFAGLKKD